MTVSELIEQLQEYMCNFGDNEVFLRAPEFGEHEVKNVYLCHIHADLCTCVVAAKDNN